MIREFLAPILTVIAAVGLFLAHPAHASNPTSPGGGAGSEAAGTYLITDGEGTWLAGLKVIVTHKGVGKPTYQVVDNAGQVYDEGELRRGPGTPANYDIESDTGTDGSLQDTEQNNEWTFSFGGAGTGTMVKL